MAQKKKQKTPSKLLYGLLTATVILAISTVTLAVLLATRPTPTKAATAPSGVHVSMGVMDLDFSSGKAVKTNELGPLALKALLTRTALNDLAHGCSSSYYSVMAFNPDKTQVRLRYGCNSPDAPMFAIKSDDDWKLLSPTNHFDDFGNPDCTYATQNNIDRVVAPVCVNNWSTGNSADVQYVVR